MEGAGEGVVAILQGTKNAGLRVTLVPDNRHRCKRKCMLMDLDVGPPTRPTQSSVETNTERVLKNASEPMCDVRYVSSYQFTHCKAVQSSFRVSEFPKHSTFNGHSDQFADSLRKYPVQASSEILQRIINYSNTKQNTRRKNLRSTRSVLRKSTSQQMNRRYESGMNTNNEIYERRPLNKSISPIGKKYSSQKELLSYTYDYLKCISLIPKSADVRYLTQVKKCIRNRLLDIIDDRTTFCPRIRSRYSYHKRHFHGSIAKPTLTGNKNEIQELSGTTQFTDMACPNTSYSRRKTCFCHQPKKCNCTPMLNKQNPLESLMKKLYPELNLNKKEIHSNQKVLEPKIHEPENVTIKPHDGVDANIMTAISEWLKSIPVYPNFSANDKIKQEELAFRLAKNLSSLNNHVDFLSKAKKEILLCVNDLPMWHPSYLNEKEHFIERIVADLLKRLVDILEKELRYKVAQAISNLSYKENVDKEKIVNDFVNKIKSIVLHPPQDERDYIQALKSKILDSLDKLPIQSTIEKIYDVVDKLINDLLEFRFSKSVGEKVISGEENTFSENILKWLENVPELQDIDFAQNMDLIDELANKFKNYGSQKPIDESLQGELVKAIRVWLEDVANSVNLRLNSKTKNRLSNKMANDFFGKDYNNSLNKRKSSEISTTQEALEPLLKWYYGIQELAGGERAETIKAIDRLAKELNEIQSRDYNFENMLTVMKEVITDWLQNMLKRRSKHLDTKGLDNYVNKLIPELNLIPKPKKQRPSGEYGKIYKDIVSWIKDITYLKPDSHVNQIKEIEKLVNKLNNIRKGSDIESTMIEAVIKFIQSLSENLQVRINEEDIQILKDTLFERLKSTFKQRKRWEKANDLCQSILSEFSNNLRTYSNILGDTKLLNDKFYRKFIENLEENGLPDWNYLLRQLNNIFMEETKLPKHECEDLANSIITRLQRMFPQEMTRRSTILSQPVKTYVEHPRINEHILDATKKHRTQKYRNYPESAIAKNKIKRKHRRNVNLQAGDGRKHRKHSKMSTIYKSSNSDLETHDSVDYYDNKYKTSENQYDHSAFNKHEEFRTSTPFSAVIKNIPPALDVKTSIENLTRDSKVTLFQDSKLSNQPEYLMELKHVIRDWITSIGLSTNNFDLDNIVDSIAFDIIDRQKYLQLSGTEYSENDELDHLKYQIFRKLNKLKKFYNLPLIMSKTNSLYRLIKHISVPDFIKPVNESHIPTTSVSYNSIFNKISDWLDNVPSNLLKSTYFKKNPALINKLVQDLKNIRKNNQYDYEIEKNILLWLQNILKDCDDNTFHELAMDLKSNFQDTALKTSKSELIDVFSENISEAILAWLQTAPFYEMCTLEERDLQEKLALLLATNLRNILETTNNEADNLNDELMEEVQKYLKTIPVPIKFRNNIYYYKAAGELVEHLKQTITKIKDMCDDINNLSTPYEDTNTQNDFMHYNDLVMNIINTWCENLPIHLGHSFESKEQAKKLKHDIAMELLEKLFDINRKKTNNDVRFEIILSDEINKIFQNVPINRELERSLPILKSILIEKLKQAKIQTQSLDPKEVLQDTLTKTLQEIENTPDLERASLNLLKEKLADAFINLYYHASTDYEFRDKLKEIVYNEINKFCNAYLERYPFSPLDSDELRFNLNAILKKVPIPDLQQHPDISDDPSKMSFEKDVTSKNVATQYTSPQFLPSTLSNEDRAHLELIRERAASYPETANSKLLHKDWSPKLKDKGVVTDCKKKVEKNIQTSRTLLPEKISKEILPQVVIKEFYWDSNGSKQSFQMFVPPGLTNYKMKHRKPDTNNSQNQTETNVINNSTKVNISQHLPDTRKASYNKVDKASDATSHNKEKQEHLTNTYINSPIQKSQNNQTLILPNEWIHKQSQTEKPFYQYHKKRDTYPDIVFDNGDRERYWFEQPRSFDDERYIRKDYRQPHNLKDFVKIPTDREMLTKRIFLTSENGNKENISCDCNTNANWRMGEGACRRKCNTLKHCSKCCDGFCPHPTLEFFKKTF